MIGHPDDCTCHGCAIRPPITNGHADPWRPGETWRTETLPWLVGPDRPSESREVNQ